MPQQTKAIACLIPLLAIMAGCSKGQPQGPIGPEWAVGKTVATFEHDPVYEHVIITFTDGYQIGIYVDKDGWSKRMSVGASGGWIDYADQ